MVYYSCNHIDHTISDAAWRDDMINNNDWDAYHLAGKEDKPIAEIVQFIESLAGATTTEKFAWEIIALTARPGKWRKQTMEWMGKYGVIIDEILMRPDDSYKSAGEMKVQLLKERFGESLEKLEGCNVILIDDNEKVIEAVRALGITTLHIAAAKRRTQ